jgi:zinc protease
MQWFEVWQPGQRKKFARYILTGLAVCVLVILGLGRSPALAVTPRHYTQLTFGAPPEIKLPDYTRFELGNGMKVYLLEDHELPLVYGTAMIDTGDRFEPADKTGLADITGDVMRSGGSQKHPPDQLNQLLEQKAASVETSIDTVSGAASFSALSEDLNEVFGLFTEVVRQPAFPQDKIDFSKNQWRGVIARRNDDPGGIADREFSKLIYGANSPYARTVEYTTLDNISRDDVVKFYQTYFHPNNMLLGIVGDFDTKTMRSQIEQAFGDWQRGPALNMQVQLPKVSQAKQGGLFLVNQPQLTQSYVQIGHLGGELKNPDYAALSVMNEVMNGLGGRLVNEVRSRQGLAYTVYAYWSPRFDYPGLFVGGGQTRSEATVPFIKSTKTEIEKIRTSPISQDELKQAKESVLNSFIFNFATPSQTLSRVMRYDYFGYPQDFIFQYQKQVEATTIKDIQAAAQTHLKPENLVTLVVGNASAINPPLTSLNPSAPVTQLDVTIPQPGTKS